MRVHAKSCINMNKWQYGMTASWHIQQSTYRERYSASSPQMNSIDGLVSQPARKRFIGAACLRSKSVWSGRDCGSHLSSGSTLMARFPGNGYEWIIRGKQLLIIIKFWSKSATRGDCTSADQPVWFMGAKWSTVWLESKQYFGLSGQPKCMRGSFNMRCFCVLSQYQTWNS